MKGCDMLCSAGPVIAAGSMSRLALGGSQV